MKPVAIDLFCGKGGWTNGLMEAGFEVYGFDIEPQPDYKGIFVQCDILALTAEDLRRYGAVFATCSSPCEQFSVHGLKCFHPNPKFPEMGLRLFNHGNALLDELDIPYIMENVRSAEKFVGKAVNHYGPFYLWGNAVPAVVSPDCYKLTKGTKFGLDKDGTRNGRKLYDRYYQTGSRSKGRTDHIASVAMIPLPIALAVAETAWNLTQAQELANAS